MRISVVIPNKTDLRVKRLISNLYRYRDKHVLEIILALNDPSEELAALAKTLKTTHNSDGFTIRICDAGMTGNASCAYNAGIAQARYPYVLILDSDIVIHREFFTSLCRWVPAYDIVKGHLRFYCRGSRFGRVIANSRMANTSNVLETFSPGILFNKGRLQQLLGEEIYDRTLKLTGDCDLSMRIRRHNDRVVASHDVGLSYDTAFNVFD